MRRYFALERLEFWLGMIAFLGVILIIYRASRPEGAIFGQVPGAPSVYSSIERHPENQGVPGVLIFRLEAPLSYANASVLRDRVRELVHASAPPAHCVVLDLSANSRLDITSAETLAELVGELSKEGVKIVFAETHQPVRDMMTRVSADNVMSDNTVFSSVDAAVRACQNDGPSLQHS
jgi:sulfate permease, SulP family